MKRNVSIQIYKNNRGPKYIFDIADVKTEQDIIEVKKAVQAIILSLLSKKRSSDTSKLQVDIAIKYNRMPEVYSMNVFDDEKLSNLKNEFLNNEKLKSLGLKQISLGKKLC